MNKSLPNALLVEEVKLNKSFILYKKIFTLASLHMIIKANNVSDIMYEKLQFQSFL